MGGRGKTVALRERVDAPVFSDENAREMGLIREGMRERLLAIRAETMGIVVELDPLLAEVLEVKGGEEVTLLSSGLHGRWKAVVVRGGTEEPLPSQLKGRLARAILKAERRTRACLSKLGLDLIEPSGRS